MAGDTDKFLYLKRQKGRVTFGDNTSGNIIGKGTVNVGKDKAKNVLLVENMKPSLLSVIQTYDQGHICIFYPKKCEIRRKNSGKLVGVSSRTLENVYILNTRQPNKKFIKTCILTFSLVIVLHALTLDTKQLTVEHMEGKT